MKALHSKYQEVAHYGSSSRYVSYIIAQCFVRFFGLFIPYLTEQLIDSVSQNDQQIMLICGLKVILAGMCHVVFLTMAYYIKVCYEDAWIVDKKNRFLSVMAQLPMKEVQKKGSAYFLQRFTSNIEGCRSFIIDKPVNFFLNVLYSIGLVFSMLRIDVQYALVLLLSFPILALLYRYLAKKVKMLTTQIEDLEERANSLVEEVYSCNYAIRTSNAEKWYAGRTEKVLAELFTKSRNRNRIEAVYDYFFITGLLNLISILVYVIGGYLALFGRVSYGMIIAMSLYYSKLWTPLEFYLDYPKQFAKYKVHRQRLDALLSYKTNDSAYSEIGKMEEIALEGVSYQMENVRLFDSLSFVLREGDHISISGSNGSGKTTLANLIAAIDAGYTGKICYNQIDYREIAPSAIRQHICLIPAKPELFCGTIGENLLMGTQMEIPPSATEILAQKGLTLDYLLQDNGTNVSCGEAKLIQILRGLCRNCDLYIVDEPLNYIDDAYVEMIIDSLEKLLKDKTVMIISHDRRVDKLCTKHYVLSNHKLISQ